jgi:hypothetical protein
MKNSSKVSVIMYPLYLWRFAQGTISRNAILLAIMKERENDRGYNTSYSTN